MPIEHSTYSCIHKPVFRNLSIAHRSSLAFMAEFKAAKCEWSLGPLAFGGKNICDLRCELHVLGNDNPQSNRVELEN